MTALEDPLWILGATAPVTINRGLTMNFTLWAEEAPNWDQLAVAADYLDETGWGDAAAFLRSFKPMSRFKD